MSLIQCPACERFIRAEETICPFCNALVEAPETTGVRTIQRANSRASAVFEGEREDEGSITLYGPPPIREDE